MKIRIFISMLILWISVVYSNILVAQKGELVTHIYAKNLANIDETDTVIMAGSVPIQVVATTDIQIQYKKVGKNNTTPPTRVRIFYNDEGGVRTATKIVSEVIMVPGVKFVFPIPSYIPPTAISGIGMGDMDGLGKIKSFGWGVFFDARIYNGFRLFFESSKYKYSQVLANEGSTDVHALIGAGTTFDLPDGAKYSTETTVFKLGIKHAFLREKNFHPYIGLAYGFSNCNIIYQSLDEDHVYGKTKDYAWRSSIIFGVDYKRFGSISIFIEAISPAANYSINLPEFGGTYSSSEGMTYPTPRIGISFSGY
jgi:hypothetical protein